jgi:hypothetical protein
VDSSTRTVEQIEEFERKAQFAIRLLTPRTLLLEMHVAQERDGYHDYGHGGELMAAVHLDGSDGSSDDARLRYQQRRPYLQRFIETHDGFRRAQGRLTAVGVRTRFFGDSDYGGDYFLLGAYVNERSLKAVRALAKEDAGIRTRAQSAEFDRRFDLYVKQQYAKDWKEWREREPLVEWP